jgi:hypothetical protein
LKIAYIPRVVRGDADVPVSLEDALKNMAVIDAIFRSGDSGKWETLKSGVVSRNDSNHVRTEIDHIPRLHSRGG